MPVLILFDYICIILNNKFLLGSIEVPVVMLVLEGGPGTVKTMTEAIKKKIPTVVIDGSGRAADVVAFAYKHTIPNT